MRFNEFPSDPNEHTPPQGPPAETPPEHIIPSVHIGRPVTAESVQNVRGEGGGIVPPVEPPPTAEGAGDADDDPKARFAAQLQVEGMTPAALEATFATQLPPSAEQQAATAAVQGVLAGTFDQHRRYTTEVVNTSNDGQPVVHQRLQLRHDANGRRCDIILSEAGGIHIKAGSPPETVAVGDETITLPAPTLKEAAQYLLQEGSTLRLRQDAEGRVDFVPIGATEAAYLQALVEVAEPPKDTVDELLAIKPEAFVAAQLYLSEDAESPKRTEMREGTASYSRAVMQFLQGDPTVDEYGVISRLLTTDDGVLIRAELKPIVDQPPRLMIARSDPTTIGEVLAAGMPETPDATVGMQTYRSLTVDGQRIEDDVLAVGVVQEVIIDAQAVADNPDALPQDYAVPLSRSPALPLQQQVANIQNFLAQQDEQ
jgi:hypothetical protein